MDRSAVERFIAATLPGRKLGDQLFGAGAYGDVYELFDERFAGQGPRKQVIRILSSTLENGAWRAQVSQRTQALLAAQLPAISRPLEAGDFPDGGIYLIGDFYGQPLDGLIQDENGLPPAEVLPIVRQLLQGLAALHVRGLAHGDIRPKNIFLVPQIGSKIPPSVWLIDAPIGGLANWSSNALLDGNSQAFYPPEWRGAPQTPSPSADLWALGLTICEMLLGRQGNPQRALKKKKRRPGAEERAESRVRVVVDGELKKRGVGRALRRLVGALLSEEAERPNDGVAAADLLTRLERNAARRPLVVGVAAACSVGFLIGLFSLGQHSRLVASSAELESTKTDLESARSERDTARSERDNAKIDFAEYKRAHPPDQLKDPLKREWGELIAGHSDSYDGFRAALRKVADPKFAQWYKRLLELVENGKPWFRDEYRDVVTSLARAFDEPWKKEYIDEARQGFAALEEAAKSWREWANKDELLFSTISAAGFVKGLPISEKGKDQLQTWLTEAAGRTKWTVRLIRGSSTSDKYGTRRQFGISGGSWVYTDLHDWTEATKHNYTTGSNDAVNLCTFQYQPNNNTPIECILYGDGTLWTRYWRTKLIDETFKGPLPFWKLHHGGPIQRVDGSIEVELEIEDCPGPPKDWAKDLNLPAPLPRKE